MVQIVKKIIKLVMFPHHSDQISQVTVKNFRKSSKNLKIFRMLTKFWNFDQISGRRTTKLELFVCFLSSQ